MIKRLFATTWLMAVLCFPASGLAKCAALLITIEGEVRGQAKPEESVTVDVQPESYWSFQLVGNSPQHFIIQVPFDTFSSYTPLSGHRCDRRPKTITVTLQDWLQGVDGVELMFPDDFVADKRGDYHAVEKVVLDVDHIGLPWIRKLQSHKAKAPSSK